MKIKGIKRTLSYINMQIKQDNYYEFSSVHCPDGMYKVHQLSRGKNEKSPLSSFQWLEKR